MIRLQLGISAFLFYSGASYWEAPQIVVTIFYWTLGRGHKPCSRSGLAIHINKSKNRAKLSMESKHRRCRQYGYIGKRGKEAQQPFTSISRVLKRDQSLYNLVEVLKILLKLMKNTRQLIFMKTETIINNYNTLWAPGLSQWDGSMDKDDESCSISSEHTHTHTQNNK